MLLLNRGDIADIVTMDDVLLAVEAAHRTVASGAGAEGPRSALALTGSTALLIPMSGALGPLRASGLKILTDAPDNPASRRPRQQSTIVLIDAETNAVEAVLDGAQITMVRTAAASAVATRYLSRTDSDVLGLVGAGTLARTHLQAISAVRPIRRVVVWTRNPATLDRFAAEIADRSLEVVAADSVQQVAAESDIICTLTPSRTPVLRGAWLRPGTHVNAVGAPPRPGYREIDTDVIARSRVVVDSLAVALQESSAIRQALDDGAVDEADLRDDLGQVVTGQVAGREHADQITLYNSVGLGIQDLATARAVVDIARRRGIGTDFAMTATTATQRTGVDPADRREPDRVLALD